MQEMTVQIRHQSQRLMPLTLLHCRVYRYNLGIRLEISVIVRCEGIVYSQQK